MLAFTHVDALKSYAFTDRVLTLDFHGPRVSVTVLTEKLIRVRLAPNGEFPPRRSWAVAREADEFPVVPFRVEAHGGELALLTTALNVSVEVTTGRIRFSDPQGRAFSADAAAMEWGGEGSPGVRITKRIESGEHFYGFGERGGLLEKTGRRLVNWTTDPARAHGPDVDPMYIAIPIYLSVRPGLAYGVFFNNTWRSHFDVGRDQPGALTMQAEGGEADYFVAYGPTPAEVLRELTSLLGRMPLPPRWALGHHQSRWSYMSADEVRELAAAYRARDLPCDVIHLDIDYMHGYRVFTWDPARFPNPQSLIANLRQDGFRAVTIIDPGVKADPHYAVYQQGLERDYFIRDADGAVAHGFVWPDDAVFADFTRPEVRTWWGDWQKVLVEAGVSGIWNDMNEPVVFDKPFSQGGGGVGTLPLDAAQGPRSERTTHAEVHNLFGYHMARASYEGLRRHLAERPFVLTRSGFAGIQRWSACWMGDNHSWWEHLEMAMPQLMNMGLSSVPFVGVDIGGFSDNCSGELLARWAQFGVFMPFCRNHSAMGTARHEPWMFGPHVEAIYRDYLRLRYRLLPYLYSLFWEAAQTGAPILRPLLYHFPDDSATYHLHDEAMLGPFLLAAPIYRPGQTHRAVYLPAGEWFDWHTNEKFTGPTTTLAHAPLERLPLYARAGAVLPMGGVGRNTEDSRPDPLTLQIYRGEGEFRLYEDDGRSFDYERGEWAVTHYRLQQDGTELRLKISAREGRYAPPARQVIVNLQGLGEAQTFQDDGSARELVFAV
jgi:alpha-glucosidase